MQISYVPPVDDNLDDVESVRRLLVPAGHVAMMSFVELNMGYISDRGKCENFYVNVYTGSNAASRIRTENSKVCLSGTYTSPNVYTADTEELYLHFVRVWM